MDLSYKTSPNIPSRSIIFDLDGTLIDSHESILKSIRIALNESGLQAKVPITKSLIGPPLIDTLSKITSKKDYPVLNALADKFKVHYDALGYRDSVVYPGIDNLLGNLRKQGFILYIATNKRSIPTNKIVDYLLWSSLFSAIYSIDSNGEKPYKNKAEMISALLKNETIDPKLAVYIGDRVEDYHAADSNGLKSILVDWGYGEIKSISNRNCATLTARDPADLLLTLQRILG